MEANFGEQWRREVDTVKRNIVEIFNIQNPIINSFDISQWLNLKEHAHTQIHTKPLGIAIIYQQQIYFLSCFATTFYYFLTVVNLQVSVLEFHGSTLYSTLRSRYSSWSMICILLCFTSFKKDIIWPQSNIVKFIGINAKMLLSEQTRSSRILLHFIFKIFALYLIGLN